MGGIANTPTARAIEARVLLNPAEVVDYDPNDPS
jgi:hypothetical protein